MIHPYLSSLTLTLLFAIGANGMSEDAVLIATGEANRPKQPQAAVDSDGVIHVVFGVGDEIHYSNSRDEGKSFSSPLVPFTVPNLSLGMRRGPRIAAHGNNLVITAIGGKQGKGRDGDVLAWRSSDQGKTWKGPVRVNDAPDSAREGLHAMAVAESGDVWCAWLDLRNSKTELFASHSTDGGGIWSPNRLIYSSPEKNICECCHPSIAIHGDTIHFLFRNSLEGNRDMYWTSMQLGKESPSIKTSMLGKDHWKLNACPMDGGMIAANASGKVSSVWRRGGQIFATIPDQAREVFQGEGEQPWLVTTGQDSVAVWTKGRDGELVMKMLSQDQTITIAKKGRDAVLVSFPKEESPLVVLWEENESGRSSLFAKRVSIRSLQMPKD